MLVLIEENFCPIQAIIMGGITRLWTGLTLYGYSSDKMGELNQKNKVN
jgi:hypothetical protein